MGLLDRVLGRPQNNAGILENPAYPLTSTGLLDALHIPYTTNSSTFVTEASALNMAAVWRAVTLIASTCASLPLHPYKDVTPDGRTDSYPQRQQSGIAADLLDNPNPTMTPYELWETVYSHVALWGNGYLQVLRDRNGIIRELWPICPWRITPGRTSDGYKIYQFDNEDGYLDFSKWPAARANIFHIPGFGYDGISGLSPIGAARQGIGLALAAEEFGGRLFGSGSLASGFLTTEQRLSQEKADALKARWQAKIGGVANAHQVAVLDSGAKFQQLTIPPEDAQFIQSRSFQIEEIARMYGVPPHMLMSTEKSTSWGTGIEQQTLGFVVFSLRGPWLTRFEQRVSQLIGPGTVYARYQLEGLLRGDSAQRSAFYQSMWNMGVYSTNDIRALEQMPPVEGGDVRYRPLNYDRLGTTNADSAAAPDDQEPADAVA